MDLKPILAAPRFLHRALQGRWSMIPGRNTLAPRSHVSFVPRSPPRPRFPASVEERKMLREHSPEEASLGALESDHQITVCYAPADTHSGMKLRVPPPTRRAFPPRNPSCAYAYAPCCLPTLGGFVAPLP